MSIRDFFQYLTAVVTLITIFVLIGTVKARILSWHYIVLPVLIGVQRIAFYVVVFVRNQPPTENLTMWSSIITLQEAIAVLLVVSLYWLSKKKYG